MGNIGYFNTYHLDPESASYILENFDFSFDVLEAMNGPYFHSSNSVTIEDWFHLLNRGHYFPIVGSSDSHSVDRAEPGYSRTYVFYTGREGDNLDRSSLIQALKKGRSFATNGPLIYFKVNDNYTSGDLLTATNGEVKISIKVETAPWIAIDEVKLIINGERRLVFPMKYREKSLPIFLEELSLKLKKDSYIVVEVSGTKSLFPVLQSPAGNGELEKATLPYALTNPVFIDVDGNGKFDPPWPEKIKLTAVVPESKISIK
jgi:hypothetical protein